MKIHSRFFISVLLLALLGPSSGFSADKEKVEEGRYARLRDGGLVQGTEHSWTLWRLPDGRFELEDHFQIDKSILLISGMLLTPGMRTSPEFRKSLEEEVSPSDLSAIFDSDRQLVSLTVTGLKTNGAKGVGLQCKTDSGSIECRGTSDKAKLRLREPRRLFWWFNIPVLLRSWPMTPQETAEGSAPRKIVLLSFGPPPRVPESAQVAAKARLGQRVTWGDRPALEPVDLNISSLGPDTLVMGNKSFHARKYKLEARDEKFDQVSLTAWADAAGVVLAVEDSARPGDLIALVEYKNYTNPPAPPATQLEK